VNTFDSMRFRSLINRLVALLCRQSGEH
jgi:hypothetical protein